jgi:hypothetical protein
LTVGFAALFESNISEKETDEIKFLTTDNRREEEVMKKIAMLLIMGGIFLILSLDATAGITYPRNQVGIQDVRLNEHPWGDVYSRITPSYTTYVFHGKPDSYETGVTATSFPIVRLKVTIYSLRGLFSNLLDRFGNRNDQLAHLPIIK